MDTLQKHVVEIEKSLLAFDKNIFKVYRKNLVTKEIYGKLKTIDERRYLIEEILEKEISIAFDWFEKDNLIDQANYSIDINLEFLPKCGYFFKLCVENNKTDFSTYTTVHVNGVRRPAIVADFKLSIDSLIDECAENEREYAEYDPKDYYPAY